MNSSLLLLLPLQVGLVLLTAHGLGYLAHRLGQPRLIGQMAAGLLLGPAILGSLWPELQRWLFAAAQTPWLALLGQTGLALFMLGMGLEFRTSGWGEMLPRALRVAGVAFALPFVLGGLLAYFLLEQPGNFGAVSPLIALGFLALALAVTAFPVLARMLQEAGLSQSRLGVLVLLTASLGDGVAWTLLTVLLALMGTGSHNLALELFRVALYLAAMGLGVRPLLRVVWPRVSRSAQLLTLLPLLLLSVFVAEKVGLHAVLGAFLLGLIVPRSRANPHPQSVLKPLEPLTLNLLLPLYFAYAGLGVTFSQLGGTSSWTLLLAIVLLASLGKVGGGFWAARTLGEPLPWALAVGVLMNARGLIELVLLHIGLERGILSAKLYSLMVLMTFVTTALTPPLFQALRRRFPGFETT